MDTTTTRTSTTPRALGRATGALLPDELRLGPVRLIVSDLDRSIAWYEQVIGLRTIERSEHAVMLGTADGTIVVELEHQPGARRAGRHAGLYHVALLFPSREELARVVVRIATSSTTIDGASDHGTHEAIYLPDPDGNGLELAADRPRDAWPNLADIDGIRPRALDMEALLAVIDGEAPVQHAVDGLGVGHLHLHVGNVPEAVAFWRDIVGFELITSLDVAAFLSAGGYHHHLAVNTWKGVGVGPAPDGVVGLRWWSARVPSLEELDALAQRLEAAGAEHRRDSDGTLVLRDPWHMELRVGVAD